MSYIPLTQAPDIDDGSDTYDALEILESLGQDILNQRLIDQWEVRLKVLETESLLDVAPNWPNLPDPQGSYVLLVTHSARRACILGHQLAACGWSCAAQPADELIEDLPRFPLMILDTFQLTREEEHA